MAESDAAGRDPASPGDQAANVPLARVLAAQAFSRAAGAPLLRGNRIRLLRNAEANYPAWLEAIRSARTCVDFENYIVHDDVVGYEFADALVAKARQGLRVRVLYDWLGALRTSSRHFWRRMEDGGVHVRCFNPPRFDSPLGWVSRDHRKSICVDHRVAYVSGLCIGRMWVGDPQHGIAAWRDTGVEVCGPAVADVAKAFARAWAEAGHEAPAMSDIPVVAAEGGDVDLRVVATVPALAGVYRLDHLIATLARRTLWLTDAYFVGAPSYVQALRGAATDGVDVRLLVPGASDIEILAPVTRAGYRPLLEAGIRVFEWNGPMIHAKTAVADGMWARVGSSNLNIASWMGNWELDVVVEDARFAEAMEAMYLEDLANATEIVLSIRNRVHAANVPGGAAAAPAAADAGAAPEGRRRDRNGSSGRLAAGALRVGNAVGAAITNRRALGMTETKTMAGGAALLIVLAAAVVAWPLLLALPFALATAWIAASLLLKAYRLHRLRKRDGAASHRPAAPH